MIVSNNILAVLLVASFAWSWWLSDSNPNHVDSGGNLILEDTRRIQDYLGVKGSPFENNLQDRLNRMEDNITHLTDIASNLSHRVEAAVDYSSQAADYSEFALSACDELLGLLQR